MKQEPSNGDRRSSVALYAWVVSLSVGLAVGIGIGTAIDRIGAGVGIGAGAGAAIGLLLYRRLGDNSRDE